MRSDFRRFRVHFVSSIQANHPAWSSDLSGEAFMTCEALAKEVAKTEAGMAKGEGWSDSDIKSNFLPVKLLSAPV